MSRLTLAVGLMALAFAAGPAFAQSLAPAASAPLPATKPATATATKPHHPMHMASTHKMTKTAKMNPDMSADSLNAKELSSIDHATPASTKP